MILDPLNSSQTLTSQKELWYSEHVDNFIITYFESEPVYFEYESNGVITESKPVFRKRQVLETVDDTFEFYGDVRTVFPDFKIHFIGFID